MHITYEKQSGRINGCVRFNTQLLEYYRERLPEEWGLLEYVEGCSGDTHYYDLVNTIRPRPVIEAEPNKLSLLPDNEDSIIIPGLPIPCTVTVDDHQEYQVEDGEFEFTTDIAGEYQITCEAFPFITKSWEIEAV